MNSRHGPNPRYRSLTTDIRAPTYVNEGERVFNVDFQHQYRWKQRQNVVWGMSAYDSAVTTNGGLAVSFNPPNITLPLFGAFAQDEIAVASRSALSDGRRETGARLLHRLWLDAYRARRMEDQPNTIPCGPLFREQSTRPILNETAMRVNFTGFTSSQWNALCTGADR